MCTHLPTCADQATSAAWTARVIVDHHEQGCCLLCNGVILFDDGTVILPAACRARESSPAAQQLKVA